MKKNDFVKKRSTQKHIEGYVIYMDQKLGSGSFGNVYKGRNTQNKQLVAVKVLMKIKIDADQYMQQALKSEIKILQSIKSQNTVALYDVLQSETNYYLVQQLCDGDLFTLLSNTQNSRLSQTRAIEFLKEICNGFLALVRQGIVHRDMKPANILISKKHAKLADFGFSKRKFKDIKMQTCCGTPLYMSPQVFKKQKYTSKCDIWAVGAIFYQMLHGRPPWSASTQYQLIKAIKVKPLQIQNKLSQNTKDFIIKCLEKDQQKRISWDQLFLHPIFQNFFQTSLQKNKQFQNKLKGIMSELRFVIHQHNINLKQLFQMLGLKQKSELNFNQFSKLLKILSPTIKSQEIVYIYQKLDTNHSGKIEIKQLQQQMKNYHISLESLVSSQAKRKSLQIGKILLQNAKNLEQNEQNEDEQYKITFQLQTRVKKVFTRLFKILNSKKLTLYKVLACYDQCHQSRQYHWQCQLHFFQQRKIFFAATNLNNSGNFIYNLTHDNINYDLNNNGRIESNQLKKLILKIDQSFTQEQHGIIFQYLDKNKSNAIEFDEINEFYCKVNGIPQTLQLPEEYTKNKWKNRVQQQKN